MVRVVIRNHFVFTCSIVYCSKRANTESESYRKLCNTDVEQFRLDIRSCASLRNTEGTANDLALWYITGLRNLIDKLWLAIYAKTLKCCSERY